MTADPGDDAERDRTVTTRRRLLSAAAVGGVTLLAGCGGGGPGADGTPTGTATATATETDAATDPATATASETESGTRTATPTETDSQLARARVGHFSPNAPAVDVYVDGSVVLEDVSFGAVSGYLELSPETHAIEVTAAGDPDVSVFEEEVTLERGTFYTVAAIGELGDDVDEAIRPLLLTDDTVPPDADTATVRAVHLSPDAPAVDITTGDTTLFDQLAFGEAESRDVGAGDYTVDIRGDTAEDEGEIVASSDLSLEEEQGYTVFAAGYLTPDDEPADTPFELIVTQDTSA